MAGDTTRVRATPWARLVEPSAARGLTGDERERWALRNAVFLLAATFSAVGAGVFLAVDAPVMSMSSAGVMLGLIAGYALSRAGRRRAAGVLAIASLDAAILYNTARYGSGTLDAVYLLAVSLAFVVFERRDLRWLLAMLAVTLTAALVGASWRPFGATMSGAAGFGVGGPLRLVTIALVIASVATVLLYLLATRDRALARLRAALAEAEAASQAKSSFLANISHEIRTPLNAVLGMMTILEDTELDEPQRDCIRTARASAMSLLDVLNDVLDLSRVEAGALVLEESPFDLRAVLEESAQQAAACTRHKAIEVVVEFPPDIPRYVIGDAGRVRQIVVNLLNNAVKFTDRGHVAVTVAREGAGGASVYRIGVSDTGIGVPESERAAIFDKFRQVDSSPSRMHGGVGLGLAIVRELVARMGGKVGVDTALGEGSTFWFQLPLALDPDLEAATPEPLPAGVLDEVRVLVVDDLSRAGDAVAAQLRAWGLRAVTCASAMAALAALREAHERGAPFDIALIDRRMPGVSGLELGQTILDASALIQPAMVLMTGIQDPAREVDVRSSGFAGVIRKPVVVSELARVVLDTWRASHPDKEASGDGRRASTDIEEVILPDEARGAHILVVDDNAINQKVAVRLLENLGCRADVAAHGREALALVEDVAYDVILMDVQMPEMDGLEATAAIRRGTGSGPATARAAAEAGGSGVATGSGPMRAAGPVIIAMTAHAMEEDRRRCLEAGMDDYLRKPIKQRELARVLRSHLERRPA